MRRQDHISIGGEHNLKVGRPVACRLRAQVRGERSVGEAQPRRRRQRRGPALPDHRQLRCQRTVHADAEKGRQSEADQRAGQGIGHHHRLWRLPVPERRRPVRLHQGQRLRRYGSAERFVIRIDISQRKTVK